jgi:hypothetical protein
MIFNKNLMKKLIKFRIFKIINLWMNLDLKELIVQGNIMIKLQIMSLTLKMSKDN